MMPDSEQRLILDGLDLTLPDLAPLLGSEPPVLELAPEARERCRASREVVERVIREGSVVYGVNTGFGRLSGVRIEASKLEDLQSNLCRSHATGVGEPLPIETSRLMLALRIQALARGLSGVRGALLDFMLSFHNRGLVPVIPEQGSVGASGDLAPLAHMAIAFLGEGEVWLEGERMEASEGLRRTGLSPFKLSAKEGLALINGTQCMTALGVQTWLLVETLVKSADIAAATTLEVLQGSLQPFRADVQEARGQRGQIRTAANIRKLMAGSEILESHAGCEKVQDPYSLRCVPQVHGAVRDAIEFCGGVLEREVNAATDNPLVFEGGDIVSAGNFHGQPVSQALDFLKIGSATLANISERRIENMVNPDLSGLPAFLAPDPGLESGLMIPQVVSASLASENKILTHPASVDTIPTSANREDHVSMGVTAARHARAVARNTARVLGIEFVCGAQGLSLDRRLRAGDGVEAAFAEIRRHIEPLRGDRYLAPDMGKAEVLVAEGGLLAAVEGAVGPLEA